MHFVAFDIDGTLTRTNAVDVDCFVRALGKVIGVSEIDTDWSGYKHSTDAGCAGEIFERHCGRAATQREIEEIRDCFLVLLREQATERPQAFAPVAGAAEVLRELAARADVAIALATGSWRESALVKLAAAGIDIVGQRAGDCRADDRRADDRRADDRRADDKVSRGDGAGAPAISGLLPVPLVGCDRAVAREDIIRRAEEAARELCFGVSAEQGAVSCSAGATAAQAKPGGSEGAVQGGFVSYTYVGDAVWDQRAAAALGYEFIARASGPRAARMREGGVSRAVADFTGAEFRTLLEGIWKNTGA